MNEDVRSWLELIFRWTHVVAGVMWIGHLYFFNFVNSQVAKTYDADSKKKVIPELMPRALYWFRWGAAYTWITGILLLGFDFQFATKHHYFGNHFHNIPPPVDDFRRMLPPIIEALTADGITVVNCSRETSITCVPRLSLDEALATPCPV